MIKVNLLPVKRKKKPKPVPTFVISTVLVTLVIFIVMAYLVFFYSSRLSDRKSKFAANEQKIAELKEQIKAVEDFEKKNKMFEERNKIIEQLSKNKSIPVKLLDEINMLLPNGIWFTAMNVKGVSDVSIDGYGFTNTDIVAFVDNLKNSQTFTDIYLQESKSAEFEKIPVYQFKLTLKMKV
ncbi:MAG: PilN domain-containing protein [Nitrospirae bacterium]|nr:PilN domain-containing protein [Nitrospirota bacterium]